MKYFTSAAVAAFLCATTAFAHDYKVGEITVMHSMAFETAPNVKVAGGYMTISNASDTTDRLIEIRVPRVSKAELHLSRTDANGIARMIEQENGIEVPAGGEVTLAPGGLHVMFMGIRDTPFVPGEKIPATLVFERAGEMEVIFNVEERGADDRNGMSYAGHKMSDTEPEE